MGAGFPIAIDDPPAERDRLARRGRTKAAWRRRVPREGDLCGYVEISGAAGASPPTAPPAPRTTAEYTAGSPVTRSTAPAAPSLRTRSSPAATSSAAANCPLKRLYCGVAA